MKKCEQCLKRKRNEMFLQRVRGLGAKCSLCRKKNRAAYYQKNKARINELNKAYASRNRQRYKDNFERWAEENFGCTAAYYADWRARNPGKSAEYSRNFRERHRDERNADERERRRRSREATGEDVLLDQRDHSVCTSGTLACGLVDAGGSHC